ncbi:MAG: cell division protein FtsQ/DivIB [Ignavibacteria bacterium]
MSKRKIIILSILIVVVIVVIIIIANQWRSNIYYHKITVKGNTQISREEVLLAANLKEDTTINIEELNLIFLQDRILKHPEIKSAKVYTVPPDELVVEITEKKPIAILNFNTELKLIDGDGEIFSFRNFEKLYDLPVINGVNIDSIKNKGNDFLIAMMIIKMAFQRGKSVYNQISEINFMDTLRTVLFTNDNTIPFYFPKYNVYMQPDSSIINDIKFRLALFEECQQQLLPKFVGRNVEYIDIRYMNNIFIKSN